MLQVKVAFPNSCFGKDNVLDSLIFGGGVEYCEIRLLLCSMGMHKCAHISI